MGGFAQGFFGELGQGGSVPGAIFAGLSGRSARKQALSNQAFIDRHDELQTEIGNLQAKLSTFDPGTTDYQKTKYALAQAIQAKNALFDPEKNPGALQKFGHLLRLTKRPQAPSMTIQPGAIQQPAYTTEPMTLGGEPGLPEQTIPGMEMPAGPALPGGAAVKVQGPALTPGQLKARLAASRKATEEAEQMAAAGPLTPEQQAVQTEGAETAGRDARIQGKVNTWRRFHPTATPEQIQQATDIITRNETGTVEKSTLKPLAGTKPYKGVDGRWYQTMLDSETNTITAEPMPEGYQPPPAKPSTSKFGMNIESYKQLHNIPPEQLLTPQQMNFVGQQIALSSAAPSTTITNTLRQNANGFWVPIQEFNRRIPGFGVILSDPLGPVMPPAQEGGGAAPQGGAGRPINQYANPEDQPREVSFQFNQPWAKPSPYSTTLSPQEESEFRQWAAANPDAVRGETGPGPNFAPLPNADYDVRGHFHATKTGDPAAKLQRNAKDRKMHGSDKFKTPYDGTFSNESMYAIPEAPRWDGYRLVTNDGRLVYDDTPKTPGALRKTAQARAGAIPALPVAASRPAGGASVRVGPELFAAPNKDYTDTKAAYQAALDRMNTMDNNLAGGLRGDQQAMLSMVANHIGMTLGTQKGARITRAVWEEAIETAPWIEQKISKFFHQDANGDYIFDGWKTGVTLTKGQMDQMVNLAHEKVVILKKHLIRLQQELNLAPQGGGETPQGGGSFDWKSAPEHKP